MREKQIGAAARRAQVVEGSLNVRRKNFLEEIFCAVPAIPEFAQARGLVLQFANVGADRGELDSFVRYFVAVDSGRGDQRAVAAALQFERNGEKGMEIAERAEGI